jgi:hypothetical protein
MLKLTTAAAILALAALPTTAFAAAPTDATFQLANIAPPEEPEAPPPTPAADPNAPTSTDAPPPAPENPVAPTDTPEAVEGATPPAPTEGVPPAAVGDTPSAPAAEAAAETTLEYQQETASSGSNMGTIIGVIAFLAVAGGAAYWFMNRKA